MMRDNRYEVKRPIKDNLIELYSDNYLLATHHLKGLRTILCKDKGLMIRYNNIFKDYLDNGIIERVETPADNKELVHYLPHHPVVREDKETTKVRIVFVASLKMKTQPSLNDVLHSGPCLLPFLQEILWQFRIGKIGLVADVIQTFLQISINKEHRDLVRFLWYEDIYKENPELVTLRFFRVVFSLTCSPSLLNGTISAHLQQFNGSVNLKEFICKFLRDLYVDDSSSSFDDIEDAYCRPSGRQKLLSACVCI